jgi:hypothetical protein
VTAPRSIGLSPNMYKRPARLLVAARTDDGRADTVARLAHEHDLARWLEIRTAASMEKLRWDDLEWADLLVAVDGEAAGAVPTKRPETCRLKRWHLPEAGSPSLEVAVASALSCMAGGMRMLARLDADER